MPSAAMMVQHPPDAEARYFTPTAIRVRDMSVARWGPQRAVEMVGRSPSFLDVHARVQKVARFRESVLITGESGVGKEQLAAAIYLLGQAGDRPYVSVNCPQHQEDNLTVSELFGHVKGSFTGAATDHRGAFDEANGGVLFLDEIGDLHPGAQAMLLRTLSTGELKPLGATRTHSVSVRVVAATNRPLNHLVMTKGFRYDLFFRLRHFHLHVPPLRERGDDWRLILEHALARLEREHGVRKRFSPSALRLLEGYSWPGNVRQLLTIVTMGYAMADSPTIETNDFAALIDDFVGPEDGSDTLLDRIVHEGADFWTVVHDPFIERNLNRSQVKRVIRQGLLAAGGHYNALVDLLHLPASDYQRFMDFLRHHQLKP